MALVKHVVIEPSCGHTHLWQVVADFHTFLQFLGLDVLYEQTVVGGQAEGFGRIHEEGFGIHGYGVGHRFIYIYPRVDTEAYLLGKQHFY